jgi:AGZA family xanthine/uracil permease-like MFS transporter
MHSASLWLGISGLALMVLLMGRRVKGSIMIGILFVTFISWIPYHKATYFGEASQVKGGPAPARHNTTSSSQGDRVFVSLTGVWWFVGCSRAWMCPAMVLLCTQPAAGHQ